MKGKEETTQLKEIWLSLAGAVVVGHAVGLNEAAKNMMKDVTTPAESGEEIRLRDLGEKVDQLRNG